MAARIHIPWDDEPLDLVKAAKKLSPPKEVSREDSAKASEGSKRALRRQLSRKMTGPVNMLSDDFRKNMVKQAWLRCYSKEAAVSALGGRASRGPSSPAATAGSPSNRASSSKSMLSASSEISAESPANASPGGKPRRGRRQSMQATADMAAMLQSQLQQRMFGARQGKYAHSDAAALLLAKRVQGGKLTRRERLFLFLEEPGASRSAFCFGALMWSLLLIYAASTTLETITPLRNLVGVYPFIFLRIVLNGCFTCEALARVATYIPRKRAVLSPSLWLDVLTVVPFWLRVVLTPDSFLPANYGVRFDDTRSDFWLRVLSSLSSLRLLKLARYYEGAELLQRAIFRAATQLLVPMFMLFIIIVCCSALLVELEWNETIEECMQLWEDQGISRAFMDEHPNGVQWDCDMSICTPNASAATAAMDFAASVEANYLCQTCQGHPEGHPDCLGLRWVQQYPSVPTAMWFLLVSVTPAVALDPTVYPQTWYGQLFIFFGILFLAMPLSSVGSSFNAVWAERQMVKLQRLVRQLLVENGMQATDCDLAFSQFDVDGNGRISWQEFADCVKDVLGLPLPRRELLALWHKLDEGRQGYITITQFADNIFPNAALDVQREESFKKASSSVSFKGTGDASSSNGLGKSDGGAPAFYKELRKDVDTTLAEMRSLRNEMAAVRSDVARSTSTILAELQRMAGGNTDTAADTPRFDGAAVQLPPASEDERNHVQLAIQRQLSEENSALRA